MRSSVTRSISLLAALYTAAATAHATIVEYRNYPSQIARNYDFTVYITQGSVTKSLDVWNSIRNTTIVTDWNNKPRDYVLQPGDNWRRFSEYATDGAATLSITSSWPVSKFEIIPAAAAANVSVSGNTLTFTLSGPDKVVVRVNDDFNKMLAIFADPLEPAVNPSNYTYYFGPNADGTGKFHDFGTAGENYGDTLVLNTGESAYIAEGCVLNAKIRVDGSNVTIAGRGILRDGVWVKDHPRQKDPLGLPASYKEYLIWVKGGTYDPTNVVIRDIKLLDTNWYHLGASGGASFTATNVKLLSNQVNSDGMTLYGPVTIDDCFIHNCDDAMIVANYPITIRNCLVGTVCGSYQIAANATQPIRIEGNVHFRMSGGSNPPGDFADAKHGLIGHFYAGSSEGSIEDFRMVNVDASQGLWCRQLFYTKGMGDLAKNIILENVRIPTPANPAAINVLSGGSYLVGNVNLSLTDVYYGITHVNSLAAADLDDDGHPPTVLDINLLKSAGVERRLSVEGSAVWLPYNTATLTVVTSPVRSGARALKISGRTSAYSGMRQDIRSLLLANGQGIYAVGGHARAVSGSQSLKATLRIKDGSSGSSWRYLGGATTSVGANWLSLTSNINITWSGTLSAADFYVEGVSGGSTADFLVDDLIIAKD